MGWDFTQNSSKKDIINEIKYDFKTTLIKYQVKNNIMWMIIKNTNTNDKYIACALLSYNKTINGWGYKLLDESMHPFYYDCPLEYLNETTQTNQEWRKKVIAYYEHKQQLKNYLNNIKKGDIIKLQNCQINELTVISTKPLLGFYNGKTYSIPKKYIVTQ